MGPLRKEVQRLQQQIAHDEQTLSELNREFWRRGGGCCPNCSMPGFSDLANRQEARQRRLHQLELRMAADATPRHVKRGLVKFNDDLAVLCKTHIKFHGNQVYGCGDRWLGRGPVFDEAVCNVKIYGEDYNRTVVQPIYMTLVDLKVQVGWDGDLSVIDQQMTAAEDELWRSLGPGPEPQPGPLSLLRFWHSGWTVERPITLLNEGTRLVAKASALRINFKSAQEIHHGWHH